MQAEFDIPVAGFWPSEGAVSDDTLAIAAQVGFRWAAADASLLARSSTGNSHTPSAVQPFHWHRDGQQIDVVFRDGRLSNLIGFVYSRMNPDEAADHFLREVRTACVTALAAGRDALVPIILDGENAWENYDHNGRPFLRSLYRRISADPAYSACRMGDAIGEVPKEELHSIFPGSWIDSNFDVWIGAEEDNLAWEHLSRARAKFDEVTKSARGASIPERDRQMAWEELLIAEGSDWCWWYGPEHTSSNKTEFDELYRDHLANVYRLLGEVSASGVV